MGVRTASLRGLPGPSLNGGHCRSNCRYRYPGVQRQRVLEPLLRGAPVVRQLLQPLGASATAAALAAALPPSAALRPTTTTTTRWWLPSATATAAWWAPSAATAAATTTAIERQPFRSAFGRRQAADGRLFRWWPTPADGRSVRWWPSARWSYNSVEDLARTFAVTARVRALYLSFVCAVATAGPCFFIRWNHVKE